MSPEYKEFIEKQDKELAEAKRGDAVIMLIMLIVGIAFLVSGKK